MNYRKLNENENFKTKFNCEDNFADKIKTKKQLMITVKQTT